MTTRVRREATYGARAIGYLAEIANKLVLLCHFSQVAPGAPCRARPAVVAACRHRRHSDALIVDDLNLSVASSGFRNSLYVL